MARETASPVTWPLRLCVAWNGDGPQLPGGALWPQTDDAGPANPSAAYIIRDEKTSSITGAFTEERFRDSGIGAALPSHALDWARSIAHERCAVDFESQNILGTRFWLRHFQPICYSLIRHVDERIAWAHEGPKDEDLW